MSENDHGDERERRVSTGRAGSPPRGRDRILNVYVGDLSDAGRYLSRLVGREDAFDRRFFEEKYEWVDPFGYGGTPYDHLRGALIWYGLGARPWGRVCEVGAGEGFLAQHYAKLVGELTLTDLSDIALARARRRVAKPGRDLVGDAIEGLRGVADGAFDAVVIAEILYYVSPNPFSRYGRALRHEVARVTRPGGRVVLLHPYGLLLHAAYRYGDAFHVRSNVSVETTRSMGMLVLDRR